MLGSLVDSLRGDGRFPKVSEVPDDIEATVDKGSVVRTVSKDR